jgi:hypothetical protein
MPKPEPTKPSTSGVSCGEQLGLHHVHEIRSHVQPFGDAVGLGLQFDQRQRARGDRLRSAHPRDLAEAEFLRSDPRQLGHPLTQRIQAHQARLHLADHFRQLGHVVAQVLLVLGQPVAHHGRHQLFDQGQVPLRGQPERDHVQGQHRDRDHDEKAERAPDERRVRKIHRAGTSKPPVNQNQLHAGLLQTRYRPQIAQPDTPGRTPFG